MLYFRCLESDHYMLGKKCKVSWRPLPLDVNLLQSVVIDDPLMGCDNCCQNKHQKDSKIKRLDVPEDESKGIIQ